MNRRGDGGGVSEDGTRQVSRIIARKPGTADNASPVADPCCAATKACSVRRLCQRLDGSTPYRLVTPGTSRAQLLPGVPLRSSRQSAPALRRCTATD